MSDGHHHVLARVTAGDQLGGEPAIRVVFRVGLGHVVLGFFHCRQVDDIVGDNTVIEPCGKGFR